MGLLHSAGHPFAVGHHPLDAAGAPRPGHRCDRSRGRGPYPSWRAAVRSAGVSTSQRRPGQAPVSSTGRPNGGAADESGPNRGAARCRTHTVPRCRSRRSATKLRHGGRAAEIARRVPVSVMPANRLAAHNDVGGPSATTLPGSGDGGSSAGRLRVGRPVHHSSPAPQPPRLRRG